jgi:hypothetical protein
MMAHFIFWYGFLRIFADLFRDHGALLFGIGRNQYFNGLMAVAGFTLIMILAKRRTDQKTGLPPQSLPVSLPDREHAPVLWFRRIAFAALLIFSLVVRSAWTPEALEEHRGEGNAAASLHQAHIDTDK